MIQVGKIYQMWESTVDEGIRYLERQGFKDALTRDGFRWSESSAHSKVEIHDGGDILCGNFYKVGELDDNQIFVFGSSRLEDFLDKYDN